jgi:glutamyl-tRNA(Gln) amidotransferase subunit E
LKDERLGELMAEPQTTEPVGEVADASALVPEQLGFMCGIEVHQQLATGKLHSRQPGLLYDITIDTVPSDWKRFERKLRPARGEGGAIDIAARFESRRNRSFVYVQSPNAGLIELDDQPPLDHDEDAIQIALTVSALLEAKPVSLLQTMRKTVVDGSNTSGFQRTSLVATDGTLQTDGGPVGIDVLCLEEDSARKLDTLSTPNGEQVIYNLDRLGLPLIEIATGTRCHFSRARTSHLNGAWSSAEANPEGTPRPW